MGELYEMTNEEKFTIDCPKCGQHFDCKKQLLNWMLGLEQMSQFLEDIRVLKGLKKEGDDAGS